MQTWATPVMAELPPQDALEALARAGMKAAFYLDGAEANQQLGIAWSFVPEKVRDALEYAFNRGALVCESDIERRLLPWLLFECAEYSGWPRLLLFSELHLLDAGRMAIVPQCQFGKYRVDFSIAIRGYDGAARFYIIECDGQEFHSSPQQIRDDKKRARTIKSNRSVIGFDRLTGTQIWKDARGHAALIARCALLAWAACE